MKKLIVLIISILVITGCSSKSLNYDNIYKNLSSEYEGFAKMDTETLEGVYGVDTSTLKSYLVVTSKDKVDSRMYAIFETDNEEGKEEANYFMDIYQDSWLTGYFPEQEKLVKKYKKEEYGNYIIFVVNEDTQKIIEEIKK